LEENMPSSMVEEAVHNKRAANVLNELRSMLSIDLVLGQENIKSAVMDGKKKIEESNSQITKLKKQNRMLAEKFETAKSDLVLEKKIQGLTEEKASYMRRVFDGKTAEFIAENFSYTSKLFDKQETKKIEQLTEQAKEQSISSKVDRPIVEERTEVVEESASDTPDHPLTSTYMDELGRF
jgi:hypothetical protein